MEELKFWCKNQAYNSDGDIICVAYLVEGRVLHCPYKNEGERMNAQYPCSDYGRWK